MSMVAKVVSMMEKVLGCEVDVLAQKHAVIKRKRKFCGQSLLRMIVLTLLKKPDANFEDMALTAAQLGVHVSATAVEKRFTQPLVDFLKEVVSVALQQLLAAEPVPVKLLERFTAVIVGDSSSLSLPDELQHEFPGCGGTQGSGLAALKIQVRWNLKTGELPQVLHLREFLPAHAVQNVVDVSVRLGIKERLPCRSYSIGLLTLVRMGSR
jgi:hypothetical protein